MARLSAAELGLSTRDIHQQGVIRTVSALRRAGYRTTPRNHVLPAAGEYLSPVRLKQIRGSISPVLQVITLEELPAAVDSQEAV